MKKLKMISAFFAVIALIASCKKDNETTPCQETPCYNGGTINDNCACDCPSGFTGTNCEIQIPPPPPPPNPITILNVSINATTMHEIYPLKTNGDNEFDGKVQVTILSELEISSNQIEIYAVQQVMFYEPKGDYTTARINPNSSTSRIKLYTAPSGKKINYINGPTQKAYGPQVFTNWHSTYTLDYTGLSNHFLHRIEFIGDTSGDDLPSDGSTGRCRFRIWFDDFEVAISNN